MKKQIRFLATMLLLAVCVGSWAEETTVEYQFLTKEWSSRTEVNGTTITWEEVKAGAGFSNNGIQVTTGASGATGTCPVSYDNISKIVVTYNTNKSKGAGSIVAQIGDNTAVTNQVKYSGSADGTTANFTTEFNYTTPQSGKLKLTVNTTTNSIYLCKVAITYSPSEGPAKTKIATIGDLDPTTVEIGSDGTFTLPITFADGTASDDYEVTWTSSDDDILTVDDDGSYLAGDEAGTVTLTVSVEPADDEAYEAVSKSFEVTVYDPNAKGTENNPYLASEAVTEIMKLTSTSATSEKYYVKGVVSRFQNTSVVGDGNNYRYYISDDGNTNNELLIYKGNNLNNVAFSSADDVQLGDEVVIYGPFQKYNNTAEMAAGNYIVSLTRAAEKQEVTISFTKDGEDITELEAELDDLVEVGVSCSLEGADITYASSNENVATYEDGMVYALAGGTAVITATFAGNDEYKAASATLTVTVNDPNKKGTIDNPYTVADVIDGTATGTGIYVKGYIVGEYVGKTTNPRTSSFTTDANFAIADEYTTSPTASESIPVQLGTDALKNAWGNKTNNGSLMTYEVLLKGNKDTYFSVNGIKNTSEVTATGIYVQIASSGKSSYCAADAFELVDGVKAYTVTNVTSTSATMTELTGAVPANEGVMLVGEGGQGFTLPIATEGTANVEGNLLVGTAKGTTVEEEEGKTYLGLSGGQFVVMTPGTVKPHKAYLSVSSDIVGSNARLTPDFGDSQATAISEVSTEEQTRDSFFNLSGLRVSQPQKGLYIVNGKKVIIK